MRAAQRSGETNQGALLLRLRGDWEGLGHAWEHQCQGPGRLDGEANGGMLRSKTCSLGPPELGIVWFICQVGLGGEHHDHEGGMAAAKRIPSTCCWSQGSHSDYLWKCRNWKYPLESETGGKPDLAAGVKVYCLLDSEQPPRDADKGVSFPRGFYGIIRYTYARTYVCTLAKFFGAQEEWVI